MASIIWTISPFFTQICSNGALLESKEIFPAVVLSILWPPWENTFFSSEEEITSHGSTMFISSILPHSLGSWSPSAVFHQNQDVLMFGSPRIIRGSYSMGDTMEKRGKKIPGSLKLILGLGFLQLRNPFHVLGLERLIQPAAYRIIYSYTGDTMARGNSPMYICWILLICNGIPLMWMDKVLLEDLIILLVPSIKRYIYSEATMVAHDWTISTYWNKWCQPLLNFVWHLFVTIESVSSTWIFYLKNWENW